MRVLKVGGILVVGFISSFAHVYDILNKDPAMIEHMPDLATRCRRSQTFLAANKDHFTDGYVIEPFAVEALMANYPVRKLAIIGAEGVAAQSQRSIVEKGEDTVQRWIALSEEVAETWEAVAASIHITYFGRKVDAQT